MPQLLLEILSEEIPARMQQGAARDLERMASERLKAAGLTWETLTTYAGPRRLTLVVEGLPAATPDRSEEIKGPKVSAPEQALEGFLRKTGLTRDQLVERDGVLFAVVSSQGQATTALIPDMVDQIIRNFPWPKSMRWGDGSLRWVRPIKRILCLFDGAVVPFLIADGSPPPSSSEAIGRQAGIESGDATVGHRFLGTGRPLKIRDFADYRKQLHDNFVLLDFADRRQRILEQANARCEDRGLLFGEDDDLLDEVAGLAEWPVPIIGDMDSQFLKLPPEVIRLSMKIHQKYFTVSERKTFCVGPDNSKPRLVRVLSPHFVVVANVEASDGGDALAAGNSRVLSARLNDARFFWDEDLKAGFDAWNEKLKGVTFHAKLGTMAERVDRIAALAREIAPLVGADPDEAEQAARLAKADLASAMVGEFPELQGVMGGYYARLLPSPLGGEGVPRSGTDEGAVSPASTSDIAPEAGAPLIRPASPPTFSPEGRRDRLADAVRDHYKPQGPSDTVPTAPLTVAVALADKLDTLVGFFAIDEKPTGSKDPFALRRAALGVIRLVLENGLRFSLRQVLAIPFFTAWIGQLERKLKATDVDAMKQALAGGLSLPELVEAFGDAKTQLEHELGIKYIGEKAVSDDQFAVVRSANGLYEFFADRLTVLLRDQGQRHDLVAAVFALGDDDLVRIVRRVEALGAFLATDDGANLLAGYKRASNILRAEEKKGELPTGMVRTGLPGQPPEETALAFAAAAAATAVDAALEAEDFAAAMRALAGLRAPVDAFFTAVMVNSDVAEERDNRLKLLGQVRAVMGRVADFGQIGG